MGSESKRTRFPTDYATTGSDNKRNVQPIVINHHKGRMALAHNGNVLWVKFIMYM